MRILIMHSRYLSGAVSGENRVVEDEARLLREAGHNVALWMPTPEGTSGFSLLRTGMEAVWSRPAVNEMEHRISEHQPDVIHCHNLFPALSPAVLRVASRHGIPSLVTLHNYRLMCAPGTFMREGRVCEDCLGHGTWRSVLHRCHRDSIAASAAMSTSLSTHWRMGTFAAPTLYLAVSEFLRHKHIAGGIPSDRIVVKSNFSWPAPLRKGPGHYFLFVGRLAPEKGVATLLDAWRYVPAPLLVIGDGPELAVLRAKAPENVQVVGALPGDRIPRLLSQARALMVPSRWYEGQPRSILEAFAVGVPVVASRIGGLPELVEDGATGLLTDPFNPREWTEAAIRLLDDSETERMGRKAFESWSLRFNPDRGLELLEDAYRRAMTKGPEVHVEADVH